MWKCRHNNSGLALQVINQGAERDVIIGLSARCFIEQTNT